MAGPQGLPRASLLVYGNVGRHHTWRHRSPRCPSPPRRSRALSARDKLLFPSTRRCRAVHWPQLRARGGELGRPGGLCCNRSTLPSHPRRNPPHRVRCRGKASLHRAWWTSMALHKVYLHEEHGLQPRESAPSALRRNAWSIHSTQSMVSTCNLALFSKPRRVSFLSELLSKPCHKVRSAPRSRERASVDCCQQSIHSIPTNGRRHSPAFHCTLPGHMSWFLGRVRYTQRHRNWQAFQSPFAACRYHHKWWVFSSLPTLRTCSPLGYSWHRSGADFCSSYSPPRRLRS
mmetsp:Transcript_85987/g.175491  ORF Transcript_85987/g.175491 Transcript_85987/m.175491 type:complete len:288 (+) Transcript_85987:1669-2532(+)